MFFIHFLFIIVLSGIDTKIPNIHYSLQFCCLECLTLQIRFGIGNYTSGGTEVVAVENRANRGLNAVFFLVFLLMPGVSHLCPTLLVIVQVLNAGTRDKISFAKADFGCSCK